MTDKIGLEEWQASWCQACHGSGEHEVEVCRGEDRHFFTANCPECGGTGMKTSKCSLNAAIDWLKSGECNVGPRSEKAIAIVLDALTKTNAPAESPDPSKCRNRNCGQWVDNCDYPDCCIPRVFT